VALFRDRNNALIKQTDRAGWLTPVILATHEAEIRRTTVQSQPRHVVWGDPISKEPISFEADVAQGVGLEFKPQYHQRKKKKRPHHIEP
jgi:hypothetical protein